MNGNTSNDRGLTRRERWPRYLAGMVAETGFILGLALIALLIAVLAKAVF